MFHNENMRFINNIVINNIKDLLNISNKKQSDLARFLDLPRQSVSRILNNERDITLDELDKIAKYFNIEIKTLYENKGVKLSKKQILYHGSSIKKFVPTYGQGDDRHDYGRGFYLSLDPELAKEWAVCNGDENGYLHKYELDTSNLSVLYLNETYGVLEWLATLVKHRSADSTKKYKINEEKLVKKYLPHNIEKYDVIVGYRADDSYFSFAKNAIKNNIDISLLKKVMKTGDLGYQVFLQSKKAFKQIKEVDNKKGYFEEVDHDEYFIKYEERDHLARERVAKLMDSDENTLQDTIERYLD